MKKVNTFIVLLAFSLICLMPSSVQAYLQLDDPLYDSLFSNASSNQYNVGAVLIYRGWNKTLGYKTEMIKALPHMNMINLTSDTLKITAATGVFKVPDMGLVSLARNNAAIPVYAYSFDLSGIKWDDNNDAPGPAATVKGDNEWHDAIKTSGASSLAMTVGNNSFILHLDSGNRYNKVEVGYADLVTMSLRDGRSNRFGYYAVNNNIVNRGMVYLTGYTDAATNRPYEVFLVAGDRINITLLVKYKDS